MRCFAPAATFSAMNTNTFFYKFNPGSVEFLERFAAKIFVVNCSGPDRHRGVIRIFIHPWCPVMGDIVRKITPAALSNFQIGNLRNDRRPNIITIRYNDSCGIILSDNFGCLLSYFSVNCSPHVDKKSMEQFETRTHKRLIDIIEPTAQTVDELKKLNLPSGVDITINV